MYSNILPAPGSLINAAGILDPLGIPAPGFKGVNFTSQYETGLLKSRSNRGISSTTGRHSWNFSIEYHQMTSDEYDAIANFLFGYNTRLVPFYVSLPNMNTPSPQDFRIYSKDNEITVTQPFFAGETEIVINSAVTTLLPGSMINFIDNDDALHKSTYRVNRVETSNSFVGEQPANNTMRINIFPPLQRDFSGDITVRFHDPLFRVKQMNDVSPNYDMNNLVEFSINVEEVLP